MQKDDMTTPKMTRVTVRVPKATLDQINQWVDSLGVRRSHFLGIALVVGSRLLLRAGAVDMPMSEQRRAGDDGELTAMADLMPETAAPQASGPPDAREPIAALQAEILALESRLDALLSASANEQLSEDPIDVLET